MKSSCHSKLSSDQHLTAFHGYVFTKLCWSSKPTSNSTNVLASGALDGNKNQLSTRWSQVEDRTPAAGVLHAYETFGHITQKYCKQMNCRAVFQHFRAACLQGHFSKCKGMLDNLQLRRILAKENLWRLPEMFLRVYSSRGTPTC